MSSLKDKALDRLSQVKDSLVAVTTTSKPPTQIPWDPDYTAFPTRRELPRIEGAPEGAAWFWGKDDFIGRLNLLTPARVMAASKEIRTGQIVPLNLPLNHPDPPSFKREEFKHEIKTLAPGIAYDDKYSLNTCVTSHKSGTQWDGFRHFSHTSTKTFYNNTKEGDIVGPNANLKCSIHHWAEHGIAGRGVLLDVWSYCQANGIIYDPYTRYEMSLDLLTQVGKAQGVDIRPAAQGGDIKPGDMLFVRGGWVAAYWAHTPEKRRELALRPVTAAPSDPTTFAGLAQSDEIIDWLHDCYFASVGGDMPAFEAWPASAAGTTQLHEHILALWGMPLGEMVDLERASATCRALGRWFFFFTSAPSNVPRGVSSHLNGTAIF